MFNVTTEIKGVRETISVMRTAIEERMVRRMAQIGSECIGIARNSGSEYNNMSKVELEALRHRPHRPNYIDDTHRLRQSLGYLVAVDGVVRTEDFTSDEGYSAAHRILARNNVGICLIMVAGADYAVKLTFEKGYDVLDSASIEARRQFLDYVSKLK